MIFVYGCDELMNRWDKTEENVRIDDVPHVPLTHNGFFSIDSCRRKNLCLTVRPCPCPLDWFCSIRECQIHGQLQCNRNLKFFARKLIQIEIPTVGCQLLFEYSSRNKIVWKWKCRCESLAELITVIKKKKSKYRQKQSMKFHLMQQFVRILSNRIFENEKNWLRCHWFEQKPHTDVVTRQGLWSAYIRI